MGNIDKNANAYINGMMVAAAPIEVSKENKGGAPVSKKYPGGSNAAIGLRVTGRHVGSHKPIKNHRGKIVPRQ